MCVILNRDPSLGMDFGKWWSPTSLLHDSSASNSACLSSLMLYFFLSRPCAAHMAVAPIHWFDHLSTSEKCGTVCGGPRADKGEAGAKRVREGSASSGYQQA